VLVIGTTAVLIAFVVIFWRGIRAAVLVPDEFGRYLALGITVALGIQALMNMSVVLGMGPTKGIPLPMISYGGTSLLSTLASIAHGISSNLITRAADVHLKEKRKLILVPRETPLHLVQLRNLTTCAEAGAVVLPAMPAFYTKPRSLQDAVDFIVGRICDQLGIENRLFQRWGADTGEGG